MSEIKEIQSSSWQNQDIYDGQSIGSYNGDTGFKQNLTYNSSSLYNGERVTNWQFIK